MCYLTSFQTKHLLHDLFGLCCCILLGTCWDSAQVHTHTYLWFNYVGSTHVRCTHYIIWCTFSSLRFLDCIDCIKNIVCIRHNNTSWEMHSSQNSQQANAKCDDLDARKLRWFVTSSAFTNLDFWYSIGRLFPKLGYIFVTNSLFPKQSQMILRT